MWFVDAVIAQRILVQFVRTRDLGSRGRRLKSCISDQMSWMPNG